jgi:hypothetical protein
MTSLLPLELPSDRLLRFPAVRDPALRGPVRLRERPLTILALFLAGDLPDELL